MNLLADLATDFHDLLDGLGNIAVLLGAIIAMECGYLPRGSTARTSIIAGVSFLALALVCRVISVVAS